MVAEIPVVPRILKVLSGSTGMRVAAIARVTDSRWVACSVLDECGFGLRVADELAIETTFCEEIRRTGKLVTFNDASTHPTFCQHPSPKMYGFRSYVSVPITEPGGQFFGTLCGLDPEPRVVGTDAILNMYELFADMIGEQISLRRKLQDSQTDLSAERDTATLREQFLAVLGHDLRSPLASIQSCLHLMEEEAAFPESCLEFSRIAGQNVGRMGRLIGDVLDFTRSRLGNGIKILPNAGNSLGESLLQVVEEVTVSHPEYRIDAKVSVQGPPACDVDRMCQLLANLLGNAVTHGESSRPVRVSALTDATGLTISVANGGIPIAPEVIPRLFEPFVRNAGPGAKDGLGLGLFIANEIARAHDGTLDVASDATETCFTFHLPAMRA